MLHDLAKLETRPVRLATMAYEWCSVICENHQSLGDWEGLLLVCLEIGFRHLGFRRKYIDANLIHTEHHRRLVDVVFRGQIGEAIADLLHAWTAQGAFYEPAYTLLGSCTGHLVGLHNLVSFSPRLRRLVIRSVELIGYREFEGVRVDRFIEMLNHLRVTAEDMDDKFRWAYLLLDTVKSAEGAQHLSLCYWELLVEFATLLTHALRKIPYSPQTATFLTEAQEWRKLECWMGTVWMVWPPEADGIAEEDLSHLVLSLFRQRPLAAQRLEQWMERWSQQRGRDIPESFQRICGQAREAVQRDVA